MSVNCSDLRKCSTTSSETTSPGYGTKSIEKPKRDFKKMKIYSTSGECIISEKRYFEDDLNFLYSENKEKFRGVFLTDYYKITKDYISCKNRENLKIYYTKMESFKRIKGQICIVHGFGEHSGRFLTFSDYFAKKGFIVHLIDLSGFGFSGGKRCFSSLVELHQDIEVLLSQAQNDIPLFLIGHGFGAGLLLSFLLRNPNLRVSGVITMAALIKRHKVESCSCLTRLILDEFSNEFDHVCFNATVNPTSLSRNNYNIRKYLNDPAINSFITLKMLRTVSNLLGFVMNRANEFTHPLFVIHGAKDVVTNPQDSIDFYQTVKSEDKSLKIFDDGYHQLHIDNELLQLQKIIYDWCKLRIHKTKIYNGIKIKVNYGIERKKLTIKKTLFVLIFVISLLIKKYTIVIIYINSY